MISKIARIILIPLMLAALPITIFILFIRWAASWGSTEAERVREMPGDSLLEGGPEVRMVSTRAISINAKPEVVWRWLAQLGRGAGWYSIDRLDNGGKRSAEHIVSWIPEPHMGDASAIGYLMHIREGSELVWWMDGVRFLGSKARMVCDYQLVPENGGSRLVMRVSGDLAGTSARPARRLFQFIDSIMARSQLLGIRERAENYGVRTEEPDRTETGQRDQYQLYHVIYSDTGGEAGVKGEEQAEVWRRAASKAGLVKAA